MRLNSSVLFVTIYLHPELYGQPEGKGEAAKVVNIQHGTRNLEPRSMNAPAADYSPTIARTRASSGRATRKPASHPGRGSRKVAVNLNPEIGTTDCTDDTDYQALGATVLLTLWVQGRRAVRHPQIAESV